MAYSDYKVTLNKKLTYDDNIYGLESGEIDSWIWEWNPQVELAFRPTDRSTYRVDMETTYGWYHNPAPGDDDFHDWSIGGKGFWELNARHNLLAEIDHIHDHDARGAGRDDTPQKNLRLREEDPDEYDKEQFRLKYTYGVKDAKGRLETEIHGFDMNYTNNHPETQILNRDEIEIVAAGFFRVRPKTQLFLEMREKRIAYEKQFRMRTTGVGFNGNHLDRDSNETRIFLGVKWEPTAKISGTIRLGEQNKRLDTAGDRVLYEPEPSYQHIENFDSTAWEADVIYEPRSYSKLHFRAVRTIRESSVSATFIDAKEEKLTWTHEWSKKLKSNMFLNRAYDNYNATGRTAEAYGIGGGVEYFVRKNLRLNADYKYVDSDSNIDSLDHHWNEVVFAVQYVIE
jgi:hypothetical protein